MDREQPLDGAYPLFLSEKIPDVFHYNDKTFQNSCRVCRKSLEQNAPANGLHKSNLQAKLLLLARVTRFRTRCEMSTSGEGDVA